MTPSGNTIVVGGYGDNSNVGAAWVFTQSGGIWSQQGGKIIGTGAVGSAQQGRAVSISTDGLMLSVGGIGDAGNVGAVWIFTQNSGMWQQSGGKLIGTGYVCATSCVYQGFSALISPDTTYIAWGGPNDNGGLGALWIFTFQGGNWTQLGLKLVGSNYAGTPGLGAALAFSGDSRILAVCGGSDNSAIGAIWLFTSSNAFWSQFGSKIIPGSGFIGTPNVQGVGLSYDGSTLVMGGNGDNSNIGAIWVFTQIGGTWMQQGPKILGNGEVGNGAMAVRLAVSKNGNLIMAGACLDNSQTGAAFLFTRSAAVWAQYQPKIVGTGAVGAATQGYSVVTSSDGRSFAIGGPNDNSGVGSVWVFTNSLINPGYCPTPADTISTLYSATCNPIAMPNNAICTPVCIYKFYPAGDISVTCANGSLSIPSNVCPAYFQQGIKLVGTGYVGNSSQGVSSAVSGDGSTIVVGGPNDNNNMGAAWVFSRESGVWTQVGSKLVGSGYIGTVIYQGWSVSITYDAKTIASAGELDNSDAGAVWIFTLSNGIYVQQGPKLVASSAVGAAQQGAAVMISTDGTILVVGGNTDNSGIGAAWIWTISFGVWVQTGSKLVGSGYIGTAIYQGSSIAISYDKRTILIGAFGDNSAVGATWVFTNSGNIWSQQGGKLVGSNAVGASRQGARDIYLSFSADGTTFAVGGYADNSGVGAAWIFTHNSGNWAQQGGKLVGSGYSAPSHQGLVSLSSDGSLFFMGGDQDSSVAGAIWHFSRTNGSWSQVGNKFIGSGAVGYAEQGISVRLSSDISTLIVGGAQDNFNIGATWIFTLNAPPSSCWRPFDTPSTFYSVNCPSPLLNGSSCTPTCNTNYTLVGSSLTITCNNGTLSAPLSVCVGVPCARPADTSTTAYSATCNSSVASGGTCTPICNTFPTNNLTILCTAGSWSYPLGVCAPIIIAITTVTTSTPALFVSPGAVFSVVLEDGDPNQFCTITVGNNITVNNRMPSFNSSQNGVVFPISVNVTLPSYYGQLTVTLPSSQFNVTFVGIPTVLSICPVSIVAQAYKTVIVEGSGFYISPALRCIVNGTLSFAPVWASSSSSSVTCIVYWPGNASSSSFTTTFSVANDGLIPSNTVPLTISGTCDSEKPGSVSGANGCVCPPGTSDSGSSCVACINGFYNDAFGSASCTPCGNNQDTFGKIGSTSYYDCVCVSGNFRDPRSGTCVHCVAGMYCPGNNVIEIEPGYWRASNWTAKVLLCPGGSTSCIGTTNSSSSLCAPGYTGPICTVCSTGYSKIGTVCVQCPQTGLNAFAFIVLLCLAVILAYMLIKSSTPLNDSTMTSSEKAALDRRGTLDVIFKVTLNYLQVLYYIGRLTSNWSDLAHRFFEAVGIVGALSPNNYTIHCAANWRFYDSLVFVYFSPIIVVSILTAIYSVRYFVLRLNFKLTMTDWQLAVMVLLYQIHPTIMLEVISSFPCEHVGGTHTSYLKADMSIDCKSSTYKGYAAFSAVYLIFYVFGMVVVVVHRLNYNHFAGKLMDPTHYAHYKYSFFCSGYKMHTYFWEGVIMLRKLGVVAFSVLASPLLQLVFGNVIITVAYVLNLQWIPFTSALVNRIESFSLLVLITTIILGCFFISANANGSSNNTLWISVFVILINVAMMIFLLTCCLNRMRDYLMLLDKYLPEKWQFGYGDATFQTSTETPRIERTTHTKKHAVGAAEMTAL